VQTCAGRLWCCPLQQGVADHARPETHIPRLTVSGSARETSSAHRPPARTPMEARVLTLRSTREPKQAPRPRGHRRVVQVTFSTAVEVGLEPSTRQMVGADTDARVDWMDYPNERAPAPLEGLPRGSRCTSRSSSHAHRDRGWRVTRRGSLRHGESGGRTQWSWRHVHRTWRTTFDD
jgi:hypothetical protein